MCAIPWMHRNATETWASGFLSVRIDSDGSHRAPSKGGRDIVHEAAVRCQKAPRFLRIFLASPSFDRTRRQDEHRGIGVEVSVGLGEFARAHHEFAARHAGHPGEVASAGSPRRQTTVGQA